MSSHNKPRRSSDGSREKKNGADVPIPSLDKRIIDRNRQCDAAPKQNHTPTRSQSNGTSKKTISFFTDFDMATRYANPFDSKPFVMAKETKDLVDQFSMSKDLLAEVENEFMQMEEKDLNRTPLERFTEETYDRSVDLMDHELTAIAST